MANEVSEDCFYFIFSIFHLRQQNKLPREIYLDLLHLFTALISPPTDPTK